MTGNRSYPHDDWVSLLGEVIELRQNGVPVRTGTVEAVMPDSSMLWLAGDGADGRSLYGKEDGHEAWISPLHLQPKPQDALAPTRGI